MSKDITKLLKIKKDIELIEDRIEKDYDLVVKLRSELIKLCDHPTVEITESYHGGGYDYVSEVIITQKCSICEHILKSYSDPTHKGYYG